MKRLVGFCLVLNLCGRFSPAVLSFAVLWLGASIASAATWNWTSSTPNAWWTNANSWAQGTVPVSAIDTGIVLSNRTAGAYTSFINENWTMNSLRHAGGGDFTIGQSGTRTLTIGAGGIAGTNRLLHINPKVTFSAPDVSLYNGSIYLYNTIDSSAGGTLIHAKSADWTYVQSATGAKSTANVTWSLEGGQFAIYNTNPNEFLGPNTLKVAGPNSGQRYLGYYGDRASNHLYISNNIEIDAAIIDNTPSLGIVINTGHSTAGATQITHFQGKMSTLGGVAFTNTSGTGPFQLSGGNNTMLRRIYWESDNSALLSAACGTNSWVGDFGIAGGWYVVNAAHAFKTNNTARINLLNSSGGTTVTTNTQFLLANGFTYNGDVSIWGGSSMTNSAGTNAAFRLQANGWVGLEGTGSAEYKGKILIARWDNHATFGNRGFNAVFYATNNGTAIFSGNIHETTVNTQGQPGMGQKAFITGGGEVRFASTTTASITNTVTVRSNTTFRLDGSLTTSILTIESGSTLKGIGTVSKVTVNGLVKPGNSIGTLTVSGDAGVSGGFEAELSLADGTSDKLAVGGALNIAGSTLTLLGGRANTTYTIATYASRTGTFAAIQTNGLASGLFLEPDDLVYGSTSLTVRLRSSSQFFLTYRAGGGGFLAGNLSQAVDPGGNGTPVAATPDKNFRFAAWSDGSTQNPRTDTNVWSSLTVTSRFEVLPGFFSLSYTAGANGSLSGQTVQAVPPNGSGSAVTAIPAPGYRFLQWSDGLTWNPRTDSKVTSNLAVTALFTIQHYTLKYTAGTGGKITGTTPQSVPYGGSGSPVTPTPNSNFLFTAWSDGSTATPRTDTSVTQSLSVTASFTPAPGFVSLIYTAGLGGVLAGDTAQAVPVGGTGTPVQANPQLGYRFVRWSDNSTANPRTDTGVSSNLAVSAIFEPLPAPTIPSFVTNLLARTAIPHPADPFVQVYVMPARDSWPLHGFRTHGIMTRAHWESVFGHVGHLSSFSMVNTYYAPVGEPWENGYDSLMGYQAAEALGRPTAGGVAKLPETATEEGRIRALYADPHGLNMKYYFHDAEEEMIDQIPGGSGDGRLRGTTWAVNWTNEASMRTGTSSDFNCATNGRLRSFSLSFGLFLGNDMYGNWPYTRLVAVGTTTNGWQVEFKSTGWKGSNTVRFITYKNGTADIAESPAWSYADALYWRTVTVTAATNPGDPSKLNVEVKVEPAGDVKTYTRTTTVNRPNAYADSPLYLLTTRAQSTAEQMRDMDDFVLRDYTGATVVSYDFEPETPGPILETLPIGTVPDRSGNGHALSAPPGAELNFTRRPTHGIRPELKAHMSKWLVDELLAARTTAGRPPPDLIDNWRISETPGRLAAWQAEGFTHGSGSEAYWLNPTLAAGENKVISLVRRGSAPTRFAWADGSNWSHLWLGNEHGTNVPAASDYDDLVALQVLQGVRWFIVFTSMSNGHLGESTMENDPAAIAVFNAEAVYNMCRVAAWYQPTSATLADSTLTAEKYGDAAIGTDTLYIRRDNAATKEVWFAAIKVSGSGSTAVSLSAPLGRVRNLKTGIETVVTDGLFNLPLTQSAEPYHFQAGYLLTYAAGTGGSISGVSTQTVAHGGSGTAVTAVPDTGQFFLRWSDGVRMNPRTDAGVIAAAAVSAEFARLPRLVILPEGLEAIGLTWNTAGGARYRLQYADGGGSYSPDAFADLVRPEAEETAGGAPGVEGVMGYTDDGSGTGGPPIPGFRAYRVRILPADN